MVEPACGVRGVPRCGEEGNVSGEPARVWDPIDAWAERQGQCIGVPENAGLLASGRVCAPYREDRTPTSERIDVEYVTEHEAGWPTLDEAAVLIGRSKPYLRQRVITGEIRAKRDKSKRGWAWRLDPDALREHAEPTRATVGDDSIGSAAVAELLGVSRRTLMKMVSDGRIAPMSGGGRRGVKLRFARAEAERVTAERKTPNGHQSSGGRNT